MGWERIRSPREPAVWGPVVAVVALAFGSALIGERWVSEHLAALTRLAEADPAAGRAAAEQTLRALLASSAGFAFACAALFAWLCRLALREGRMPPRGAWSLGAVRVATGATARRLALAGFGVAAALAGSGIALLAWGAQAFD